MVREYELRESELVLEDDSSNINEVLDAVQRKDWSSLRRLSLRPGGFGEARTRAWPYLLHVKQCDSPETLSSKITCSSSPNTLEVGSVPISGDETQGEDNELNEMREVPIPEHHPDEHQIKLDTDRSFVLYPVEGKIDREKLQTELNALINAVFHKHPQLSYFQGYHDIITVLLLTLPEDDHFACSEKISLHRLRDSMGKGLEPLMGVLRILKYLLRLADADYASLLERNTPLPYFALSNLLTLFSHDVPTLPLIQHIFDFLLCRPPIASVYLVAALTLLHKEEAKRMEEDGEEGMLHSLLSNLPELWDEEDTYDELNDISISTDANSEDHVSLSEDGIEEKVWGQEETPDIKQTKPESKYEDTAEQTSSNDIIDTDDIEANSTNKSEKESPSLSSSSSSLLRSPESIIESQKIATQSNPSSSQRDDTPELRGKRLCNLSSLLERADELHERYPPDHPSLHIASIMGPKSVISTWSEDPNGILSDSEAEAILSQPDLIILNYIDQDELLENEKRSRTAEKSRREMAKSGQLDIVLDKRTILTGAVVALAIAVYLIQMKHGNGRWKAERWLPGALVGCSERLLESLGW